MRPNDDNPPDSTASGQLDITRTVMIPRSGSKALDARPAPAAHFLVPIETPEQSIRVGIEPITIGRTEPCQLRLDDPAISGRHCVVQVRFGQLWATDLGSTNGTLVDGHRIAGRTAVPVGAVLQLGPVQIRHELRDERSIAEESEWSSELQSAARYITDLLPQPWIDQAIDIHWRLVPCRRLGGDAFGYLALDSDRAAIYLIDVCGHGLRAALHSVSILNALRRRSPAEVGADPGEVLTELNRTFPMETHGGMFFTMWYGVIDRARRSLRYSSAGHPPAILRAGGASPLRRLEMKRPPVGAIDGIVYASEELELPSGAALYLFSDGVIEEPGPNGEPIGLAWLERVIVERDGDAPQEPDRIMAALRAATGAHRFQDDFTFLIAHVASGGSQRKLGLPSIGP